MFSCGFCEISKNTFSNRISLVTASDDSCIYCLAVFLIFSFLQAFTSASRETQVNFSWLDRLVSYLIIGYSCHKDFTSSFFVSNSCISDMDIFFWVFKSTDAVTMWVHFLFIRTDSFQAFFITINPRVLKFPC